LYFSRIAKRSLIDDDLRDEAFELAAPVFPLILRDLLMPSDDYIATGPCGQIADERRFEIN